MCLHGGASVKGGQVGLSVLSTSGAVGDGGPDVHCCICRRAEGGNAHGLQSWSTVAELLDVLWDAVPCLDSIPPQKNPLAG